MPAEPEIVSDEELEDDEEDEEEYEMDLGGLLQSLLIADDGETNLPTAVQNLTLTIDKHLTTQNKILVKILSKLGDGASPA